MWSCRNEQFTSFGIAVVDHRQCDRDVPIQRPPLAKRLYVDWHRRAFAGWVWWQNGIVLALIVLVAAMSVLRWPVIYLVKWVKRLFA